MCLKASSECPDRYKRSIVDAYVNRALAHSSSWKQVHEELGRVRQVLVNNGYSNGYVEDIIKRKVNRHATSDDTANTTEPVPSVKIFYRNFFSTAHKTEENVLKDIIDRNVTPTDTNQKIELIIYYKSKKTANLLMKNSPDTKKNALKETNIVYAFTCPLGDCLKSALRHELIVDRRDDLVFPTDGVAFTIKNELAGLGGDIGFLKNELDLQVNVPLPKELVIQGSLQAGHLLPLRNNKTHCITDRFVLGGPMNIRGFEMAGIGPHSDGCSLGAEMFWAAAIHAYSPLPLLNRGSISDKFRLHAFVNTGNIGDFVLTDDHKRNLQILVRDMRLSYGAGLAMSLGGFARVELNYCIPLLLQRGDRPSQGLQFGVAVSYL